MSIYEKGFPVRTNKVIYDRNYSSFWESTLSDYDFTSIFKGVDWFHVSAITPALTKDLYEVTRFLMTKAKVGGVKYRLILFFVRVYGHLFKRRVSNYRHY